MNDHQESRPVWRIVLTVVIVIVMLFRIANACSKKRQAYQTSPATETYDQDMQRRIQESQQQYKRYEEKQSNDLFYASYSALDTLSPEVRRKSHFTKVRRDTLIAYDISSNVKVDRNSLYQNNYDDSLRGAIKTPKGLAIFMHAFEFKGDVSEGLKSVKRGCKLRQVKFEKIASSQSMSYTITKQNVVYRGYALAFLHDGLLSTFEFESSSENTAQLKSDALSFLLNNLKKVE
ncbi:MAG: hypothetical protein CFE23_15370 [Flavobacterium sp. BFFFF1]|uniref:hypothetical protein n=1 Tax=Flavobacterium sp. BFFFF1 TaxID=2015557 RepID=UPI000BCF5719|nr:hypothetical protein [Flavobacterium sp. BFFFF1]OYU79174.1 MAG: hypothetical protein CFE23_15370 [Flavobacterium sp. BFFFF1]